MWAGAASWDSVTPQVLKRVWNYLLSHNEDAPNSLVKIQTDINIPSAISPFAISEDEIIDMITQSQEDELDSNSEESDGGNATKRLHWFRQ